MKPVNAAFMAIMVLLLAACGSTMSSQQPVAVPAPALPAGAPQVVQSTSEITVTEVASSSNVSSSEYMEESELPAELYTDESEVQTSAPVKDRVGEIPPDLWPSEDIVQGYRNAEKSRPVAQRRKYPRHRACPENTSRRIAPGERLAITRGHVDIVGGWDCRNSNTGSKSFGKGRFTLPPDTGIVMRPGRDGRPDPNQMGWQTGCGNTIFEFVDKDPRLFDWYDSAPAPAPLRRREQYRPPVQRIAAGINVETAPATDVTETGAMLYGTVMARGYDGPMNCRFELWQEGAAMTYLPWFRVERVNGFAQPFRFWASGLRHGTRYGYRPYCTTGNLADYGQPMGFATQRMGYCRRHPYICSTAIGIGTGLILAGINNDWWRDDHPKTPNQPPCSGYCTDQPVNPGPTWPGDPNPAPGSPGEQPGPTWPGNNPGGGQPTQPGPGPTWPGNNPGGGQPPTGGGPTWPPTTPPPTTPPPSNPGPGPTWPPNGGH